jgi:hypothetical protein
MPNFDIALVALGALGGLLPDAVRFAKKRQEGFPGWFRKPGYWVGLAVLVVLGALAAWLGQASNWQAAIAMGFTAPEVITRLFGSDSAQTRGVGGFNIFRWWSR